MIKRFLFLPLFFGVLILNYGCDSTDGSFEDSVPSLYSLTTNVLPEESGAVHPSQGSYAEEVGVQIEARPSEGYLFDRWEGDLTGDSNPEMLVFRSDISVTAYFIPKEYKLTIEIIGNGSVKETPVDSSDDNSSVTMIQLTAEAADGWHFKNWDGDLSGSENPTTITVDQNKTVTAVFEETPVEQFTLTVQTEGQGSVTKSPDQGTYTDGTQVTLTANPASGWSFKQWQGDLSGSTNPATITVDKDKSITAVFEEIPPEEFSLSVQTTGQGSVTKNPDQSTYTDGTQVTLTANPASGWSFKQWQGDLSGSTNPATITIDKNKSVTAVFEEDAAATLAVGEVKFFIKEMELGGARQTRDFKTKDFILNVPVDGTPFHITHVQIPAGFYDEMELDIKKPRNSLTIDDPDFRDGSNRYSLVVNGVFNGINFTFQSDEDFQIDVDFSPHLEITSGQTSVIAITIDFEKWFKGKDGEILDPNDLLNTEQINKNIEDSFSDFEDDF